MIYSEFISKAKALTIECADNGLWYLEPMWRSILDDNELFFDKISDFKAEPDIVEDVLQLEVTKRNTINSKKPAILDWLFEIITAKIDPAIMEEETDYIKQVTEFMKANHEAEKLKE